MDSPVSNSGRLKTLLRELAEKSNWKWEIDLVTSPDAALVKGEKIVASSDSVVLDKCSKWVNLAGEIIKRRIPAAKIIDLESQL